MPLKKIVQIQYREMINEAARQLKALRMPPEGWLSSVRKALGMSGVHLAKRLGKSRALVSHIEKEELAGNLTLKTMNKVAHAMGCRFVYAVVPPYKIDDLILEQAKRKAELIVKKANIHMALEKQLLSDEKIRFEIERLAQEFVNEMSRDLWE